MTDAPERALDAARRGRAALATLKTKDAAWYALLALDHDDSCALGWALLAHILTETTQDPVATWVTHNALLTGLPEVEHEIIERYHRVDLWTRGLLAHSSGQAILDGPALDEAGAFRPTPRMQAWLQKTSEDWGGAASALRAARRMVAALSDAWVVPEAEDALKDDVSWSLKPEFEAWKAADPQSEDGPSDPEVPPPLPEGVRLLSDYWMGQLVTDLSAQGELSLALEQAQAWVQMRPQGMAAKVALLKVYAGTGDEAKRDQTAAAITGLEQASLEDREEARVALGDLELWKPQLQVLDLMDQEAPGHPIILTNRGIAKLKLDDQTGAAQDLESVLSVDPKNPAALANLGLVRMRQQEYGEARKLLDTANKIAPDEADILIYLAVCKNNQDDNEGAATDLRRALELVPDHPEAQRLLAEFSPE